MLKENICNKILFNLSKQWYYNLNYAIVMACIVERRMNYGKKHTDKGNKI